DVSWRLSPSGTNGEDASRAPCPVIVCSEDFLKVVGQADTAGRILQETNLTRRIPGVEDRSKPIDFYQHRPGSALSDTGIRRPDHKIQRRSKDVFMLEVVFYRTHPRAECRDGQECRQLQERTPRHRAHDSLHDASSRWRDLLSLWKLGALHPLRKFPV